MSKILATMIAGLVSLGAHAQSPAMPEQGAQPSAKSVDAANKKRATKPQGQVKAPAGPKVAETGAIGTDKSAIAGEARAETRDDRRRAKDGSVKKKTTQGGTPN